MTETTARLLAAVPARGLPSYSLTNNGASSRSLLDGTPAFSPGESKRAAALESALSILVSAGTTCRISKKSERPAAWVAAVMRKVNAASRGRGQYLDTGSACARGK